MKNLLIIFLLFFSIKAQSQDRVYDVIFFGDSVGTIKVQKKKISENSYSYYFHSEAEAVLMFIKTKTKAITDLVYKNGFLFSGYVLRKKNEEVQSLTYNWDGEKYVITDNDESLEIDRQISYCTANFFIEEPINIKEVFVERFNYFVPIEHLGNHQYLTRVDGGTNLYTYKNGILQSLKSKKVVSIYMQLKQ